MIGITILIVTVYLSTIGITNSCQSVQNTIMLKETKEEIEKIKKELEKKE